MTDALNATRAAVEEGIVPGKFVVTFSRPNRNTPSNHQITFCCQGFDVKIFLSILNLENQCNESFFCAGGGVALLYATKVLKGLQTANEDERRGVEIIENALKV